jgi:hypothetical protein
MQPTKSCSTKGTKAFGLRCIPFTPGTYRDNLEEVHTAANSMRSMIASCILLLVCFEAHSQSAPAAKDARFAENETGTILSLENAWNQAETLHNVDAMSMLIAETFAYTDDDGSFMDRAQWLSHLKQGVDQYEQLGNTDMKVHLYGGTAVVTGDYHERIKIKGKPKLQSGRFTDTWIRENGGWKCVASQATLLSH